MWWGIPSYPQSGDGARDNLTFKDRIGNGILGSTLLHYLPYNQSEVKKMKKRLIFKSLRQFGRQEERKESKTHSGSFMDKKYLKCILHPCNSFIPSFPPNCGEAK